MSSRISELLDIFVKENHHVQHLEALALEPSHLAMFTGSVMSPCHVRLLKTFTTTKTISGALGVGYLCSDQQALLWIWLVQLLPAPVGSHEAHSNKGLYMFFTKHSSMNSINELKMIKHGWWKIYLKENLHNCLPTTNPHHRPQANHCSFPQKLMPTSSQSGQNNASFDRPIQPHERRTAANDWPLCYL